MAIQLIINDWALLGHGAIVIGLWLASNLFLFAEGYLGRRGRQEA